MTHSIRAYAKINLGLHVLRRRPDGFHEIETGFCRIDWYDSLSVEPASVFSLDSDSEQLDCGPDNLICRAVKAFENETKSIVTAHFHLQKRLPTGAGLGGGSSDAAATLRLLDKIYPGKTDENDLRRLALELGSDVGFFLQQATAIGTGRGECLQPANIQPDCWIVTAFPNESSATAQAYQMCQPNDEREWTVREILETMPLDDWAIFLENDLEPAVIPRIPSIGNFKDEMNQFGAVYSAMSGSGSCVFGLFEQEIAAQEAFKSFRMMGYPASLTPPSFEPDFRIYRLD